MPERFSVELVLHRPHQGGPGRHSPLDSLVGVGSPPMWKATGDPPMAPGLRAPKSGYSSFIISTVSPMRISACPTRPAGSTSRNSSMAPNAFA